jgi:hypothetical protein
LDCGWNFVLTMLAGMVIHDLLLASRRRVLSGL